MQISHHTTNNTTAIKRTDFLKVLIFQARLQSLEKGLKRELNIAKDIQHLNFKNGYCN